MTTQTPTAPKYVDAIGSTRRLRALIALGWSPRELTRRLGCSTRTTWLLTYHPELQPRVTCATRAAVIRLYDQLGMVVPPASPAKAHALQTARAAGWLPPLAWDDDLIDLPDEELKEAAVDVDDADDAEIIDLVAIRRVIDGGGYAHLTSAEVDAAIAYGIRCELSSSEIAERLHMNQSAVEQRIRRKQLRTTAA